MTGPAMVLTVMRDRMGKRCNGEVFLVDESGNPALDAFLPAFGAPVARTLALGTAYRALDPSKPVLLTVTLQANSSISLGGASNNEGAITVGPTAAVIAGTGMNVATYKNNLGGTLVVGLNLNSQQANTYTVALRAGDFFAIRQTAGTGLQVLSAFEQILGA